MPTKGRPRNPFTRQTPTNEIQRLAGRHQKILDLHLDGRTNVQIAQILEITPQSVSNIVKSPIAQGELARRRENYQTEKQTETIKLEVHAQDVLENASKIAAETQVNLLESVDEKIQQRSAMDILDRTGVCRKTKVETDARSVTINLTPDDLLRIQTAAIEAGQELISVETEESRE